MATNTQVQAQFGGGLSACAAPHTLREDEVQSARNVDFSLELGALVVRRGCEYWGTLGAAQPLRHLVKSYTSGSTGPWYGVGSAVIGSATDTGSGFTLSSIASCNGSAAFSSVYQNKTYIAAGSRAIWDDGSTRFNWLIEAPTLAPSVGLSTAFSTFTGVSGTWTASEGVITASSGTPLLTTATTDTGTRIILTGTCTSTNWEDPQTFTNIGIYHSGARTSTVGPYGVDYLLLGFSNPSAVTRVIRDVSVGDATFSSYWHAEATLDELLSAEPDPTGLALQAAAMEEIATSQAQTAALPPRGRSATGNRPAAYLAPIAATSPWAIPRTSYTFIGNAGSPAWTNCQAVRLIVECDDTQTVIAGGWHTRGNLQSPLTDTVNGYQYYYTLARVENGVVVAEGAPSPASTPLKVQNGLGNIGATPYLGSATSGVTHFGIYRQGGLLKDAYLVDYCPINNLGTGVGFAVSDTGYPDLMIVNSNTLTRDLWGSWPSSGVTALSDPWQDRIFLASNNEIWWTTPGRPEQIPNLSNATVSNQGDNVQGFVVWDRLLIINSASVYEMDGTQFEGENQDWTLRRSGARRGSVAPKSIIKTPYGVLLLGYDGLSLYRPGHGVDESLEWVNEKIGDAWRGTASTDPAATKGSRLLPINLSSISTSCAAYADGKIYLAVPTESDTLPKSVYVLDLVRKTTSLHTYQFSITYLYFDSLKNWLMAGTSTGAVIHLETGRTDWVPSVGNTEAITWSARTREWTTPQELILNQFNCEARGAAGGIRVTDTLDGTSTSTLGTLTSSSKVWTPLALAGTAANSVDFSFSGTQSGSVSHGVWGLTWSAEVQPVKSVYARTEPWGGESERIWDVHRAELELQGTGTLTAVSYVDNVAVLTATYVAPSTTAQGPFPFPYSTSSLSGNGPVLIPTSFPADTYGNIAYTTFTVGTHTGLTFQLYGNDYLTRPEPPRVTSYVHNVEAPPSEQTIKTWLAQVNPLGTMTGTLLVDGVAVSTATFTGTLRKTFEVGLPNITSGKTIIARYSSTSVFKHYDTAFEFEPKPFKKTTWLVTYKKIGGATSMDMGRFYGLDLEGPIGAVATNTWLVDGAVAVLGTFTLTQTRQYFDSISFPPGVRGFLFSNQLTASSPLHVWSAHLDLERIGVKGLSRLSLGGTPR